MEKEMRIEVGKRYVTRNGRISGVIRYSRDVTSDYPFWDDVHGLSYRADGKYYKTGDSDNDLISEFLISELVEPSKDKVEVRKEFVMDAYESACDSWKEKIRKELPELFKGGELVKGRWYEERFRNGKMNVLFCYTTDYGDSIGGYGFSMGEWKVDTNFAYRRDVSPASEKTVGLALVAEAKRRGFIEGVRIKGLDDYFYGSNNDMVLRNTERLRWNNAILYFADCSDGCSTAIFMNGKWAEPLKEQPTELTLEQIAEKFGLSVNNLRIKD